MSIVEGEAPVTVEVSNTCMPTYSHVLFDTVTSTTYRPVQRHKSLIRCEYCDMSYDGDEHENCPHCMAPRPRARPRPAVETQDSAVFYRDNVAYFTFRDGILTNNEARQMVPEPYGTVDRR